MHQKKELSDKISGLFRISGEDFEPEVHFKVADDLVKALAFEGRVFSLSDVLELSYKSQRYEAERDKIGDYVIKPLGKFFMADLLGWHPKIEVTYWKNRFYGNEVGDKLWIAYEGKKSTGMMRGRNESHYFHLPLGFTSLTLALSLPRTVWCYER